MLICKIFSTPRSLLSCFMVKVFLAVQVGGDFARAGRSHNLVGGAVSPREYLLDDSLCVSESQ